MNSCHSLTRSAALNKYFCHKRENLPLTIQIPKKYHFNYPKSRRNFAAVL